MRRLFEARFAQGRQLADHEVLRTVASEVGMPEKLVAGRPSTAVTSPPRCEPTRLPGGAAR